MITIPLYTLLFLYLIFLAIFAVFSLINIYHIIMSASFTLASFVMTFFIFTLTVLTLYYTWHLLLEVDWRAPIVVFNVDWVIGIFGIRQI